MVALAEGKRKNIPLSKVIDRIHRVEKKCDRLIIEGAGGLLVPLGRNYTVGNLITRLDCNVIVVARNRLGTINHTLLTINALQSIEKRDLAVVLMGVAQKDHSSHSNAKILAGLLKPVNGLTIPFLKPGPSQAGMVKKGYEKVKSTLATLIPGVT